MLQKWRLYHVPVLESWTHDPVQGSCAPGKTWKIMEIFFEISSHGLSGKIAQNIKISLKIREKILRIASKFVCLYRIRRLTFSQNFGIFWAFLYFTTIISTNARFLAYISASRSKCCVWAVSVSWMTAEFLSKARVRAHLEKPGKSWKFFLKFPVMDYQGK